MYLPDHLWFYLSKGEKKTVGDAVAKNSKIWIILILWVAFYYGHGEIFFNSYVVLSIEA